MYKNIIYHYIIYTLLPYSCICCPSQKAALNLIWSHLEQRVLCKYLVVILLRDFYFFFFHLKNHIRLITLFRSHVTKIICIGYLLL